MSLYITKKLEQTSGPSGPKGAHIEDCAFLKRNLISISEPSGPSGHHIWSSTFFEKACSNLGTF